jgi:hypothetical protein
MLMADTMAIFFVFLGMMLALPGLWLFCRGLWPNAVATAADRCYRGFWSSFLMGLPITFVMIVVTKILFGVLGPLGKISGVAVVCLYMLQAHTGVAGLATSIGRRLPSPVDDARPWRATLRGGVVLELTYLLPILGWFGILPASIIVGSGAATLDLCRRLRLAFIPVSPAAPSFSGQFRIENTEPPQSAADNINGSAGSVARNHVSGPVGAA